MRYGQGYAYADVVEKATNKTDELRRRFEGIGIVSVIHFPPSQEYTGLAGYLELRFHERVVQAANAANVKMILPGHLHERLTLSLDELDIVCAGSGCVFAERRSNWLHSLEIEVNDGSARLSRKVDYRWNDEAGDFVAIG
jgi:hypothetical protein